MSDLAVSSAPTTFVLETPEQPTTGWMQLTLEDLPAVWDSGAPFARKVDILSRPEVAASIDAVLAGTRLSEGPITARRDQQEDPPQ